MDNFADRPNRIPWPPLIFLMALGGGLLLDWFMPIQTLTSLLALSSVRFAGVLLAATGLVFDIAAMLTMYRAQTNILPHRAAGKLVTHGVFSLSRNPIYVGNTLLLTGIALFTANLWLLGATMVAVFAVDRLAIRREELHLTARFGDAFQSYIRTTPRWLGLPGRNGVK